jgi:putative molybdopterin biosynthesis protein
MQHAHLAYQLSAQPATARLANPLISLLQAVQSQGSITGAALTLSQSYRHVWGELKRWEQALGEPLLHWERGQAAKLTSFGERLLYADGLAQARLAPQIEALQAELERSMALAFDPKAQVLQLHASHDEALSKLRVFAAAKKLHLDVHFTGSVDALRALNEGRCRMAGFHVRLPVATQGKSVQTYRRLLEPGQHKIIGFVQRSQGLIVAKGNPLRIKSLSDVAQQQLRFVNRAVGTGTRLLLDELLAELGLNAKALQGYRHTEPSHQAAALAVAQGAADCALGIQAAATAQGLGFIPQADERYALVVQRESLAEPATQALCKLLRSAVWLRELETLAGYSALDSGQVLRMTQVLPWWDF